MRTLLGRSPRSAVARIWASWSTWASLCGSRSATNDGRRISRPILKIGRVAMYGWKMLSSMCRLPLAESQRPRWNARLRGRAARYPRRSTNRFLIAHTNSRPRGKRGFLFGEDDATPCLFHVESSRWMREELHAPGRSIVIAATTANPERIDAVTSRLRARCWSSGTKSPAETKRNLRPELEALGEEVHEGEAQEDSRGKTEHDVRHALGHARPQERDHRDDEGGRPGDPGECHKEDWVDHVPESHGNGLFKSSALLNNIQIGFGLSLLTMPIVSMSVDVQTLRKLEELVKRRGYPSRSEAFREALRDFIDEAEWTADSGASTLILAAVGDKESVKGDLISIQHRFEEIRTMLHSHLDESSCLEIFVAEGSSGRLKEFVQSLRRAKGVKAIKFISTSRQG